jgi:hypothetical protein
VVIRIAQAVSAEAEPHRRRFPNFTCGRFSRSTSPAMTFTGRTPASGRSGEERDSAGDAALGINWVGEGGKVTKAAKFGTGLGRRFPPALRWAHQMFDLPWAPSTGMHTPVIQLANGDASITTA